MYKRIKFDLGNSDRLKNSYKIIFKPEPGVKRPSRPFLILSCCTAGSILEIKSDKSKDEATDPRVELHIGKGHPSVLYF